MEMDFFLTISTNRLYLKSIRYGEYFQREFVIGPAIPSMGVFVFSGQQVFFYFLIYQRAGYPYYKNCRGRITYREVIPNAGY
jgi:hypothetical protein